MNSKHYLLVSVLLFCSVLLLFGTGAQETEEVQAPADDQTEYSFERLVELAKAEGELTVYDTSSRIVPIGEAFAAKYGIKVNATKMGNPEQVERVKREVDAGNVQVDVIGMSDAPIIVNDLIPQGYVTNWVPPEFADRIPKELQMPLTYRMGQRVFGYNFGSYDSSPITNIWQLTEPEWNGKVFLRDPATTPANLGFFVTMTKPENARKLEEAYKDYYNKPLEMTEQNAGWEFLVRFFKNSPVVLRSDGDVGDAVGAPGQAEAPIGFYTYSKQRDNDTGLQLKTAFDVKPFIGYASGTHVVLVNGSAHPNAAKLFVHYLLTEEGVSPFMKDIGVYSPNPDIPVHPDDDLGSWEAWSKYMLVLDDELTWKLSQDVLDLWLIHAAQ